MVLLRFVRRTIGLAGLLLLTSCWSPVFNQDVSLAVVTTTKLKQEAQFSVALNGSSSNNTVFLAVPSRESPPALVGLFSLNPSNYNMAVYANTGSWGQVGQRAGAGYDSPLADPELAAVQAGPTGTGLWAIFLPTVATLGQVPVLGVVDVLTPFAISPEPALNAVTNNLASGSSVLGFNATPGPSSLVGDLLTFGSSNLTDQEISQFSSASAAYSGNLLNVDSYNGSISFGWFAYDQVNNVAYLTHYNKDSSGKYTTDGISTGNHATWTRADRVVAFLTTHQLLTREGSYYNVCDAQGNISFSFPAGLLRFAGEYFDSNGTARSHFTEVVPQDASNNSSNSEMDVRVYSIATASLSSLK